MKIVRFVIVVGLLSAGTMWAQATGAPLLVEKPVIVYPPIAKAAHVKGEVVVRFAIESDGTTSSVRVISGPLMLQGAVADRIKEWRFKTPLPIGAEREFEAVYRFGVDAPDESLDDDLDGPPFSPCCGDVISLPPGAAKVEGEARSTGGSQKIDVTPAPPKPASSECPDGKGEGIPTGSEPDDYAELFRACRKGCRDYKVRVYRDGRVEWLGRDDIAVKGVMQTSIRGDAADALMEKFRVATFWSACSRVPPSLDDDRDSDDFNDADFLTVKIGDHVKTVDVYASNADSMRRLIWAVEKVADTHRWIHGEAAREPYLNMAEDISMPKPGITALIRATYHFSEVSGQMTQDALKRLLSTPGVDVDAADESAWTALMYAAELTYDDKEIGMLLDAQAKANRVSLHGDTALMMAAYNGRLSERLLASGADINARNADGVTVLMLLAQRMDADELKAAIAAGADATTKDMQGRTALDYLREASCQKAIVPLPRPWVTIGYTEPPPCPSNTEEYKRSEAVLTSALKRRLQ
jgi:TonB family protein